MSNDELTIQRHRQHWAQHAQRTQKERITTQIRARKTMRNTEEIK